MKIFMFEVFQEEQKYLNKFMAGISDIGYSAKTIQESGLDLCPGQIISIRTQSVIPRRWKDYFLGALTRSQGYDHLSRYRQETNSTAVFGYLENYCSRAVAEHALMNMLMIFRKYKQQQCQFPGFQRDGITGHELRNKKAVVFGVGQIGLELARMLKGLEMQVKGVDIVERSHEIPYTDLSAGLAWADVFFCCASLTGETNGVLTYERLRTMPKGASLINVARGEIIPIDGIKRLLEEDHFLGVALDVFPEEGLLANTLRANEAVSHPTHKLIMEMSDDPRVIVTPHNAFNTQESTERKAQRLIV